MEETLLGHPKATGRQKNSGKGALVEATKGCHLEVGEKFTENP